MIDRYILLLWLTWYFYKYGIPPVLLNMINNFDFCCNFFTFFNNMIYGYDYWLDDYEHDNKLENITTQNDIEQVKEPPKYENKYLNEIRSINKEWVFTKDETAKLLNLTKEFINDYNEQTLSKIEEITKEIINIENEILDDDVDTFNYVKSYEDNEENEQNEIIRKNSLDDINEERRQKIKELKENYNKLKMQSETEEGIEEIRIICEEKARQFIINKRLELLDNCYIIEKTPIGNVLMIYDRNKEAFKYYSDCNIPYRYLEVAGRKYVKFFNCRPIFVDMEEELRLFEEKWEKDQSIKKMRKEEKKEIENKQQNTEINKKKNVFTKFKSYNKDAGGKISMAPPPKNSITNTKVEENKEDEKIILKEKANRYTYEGKFANFNFLKKIEKKVFNKKLGLSFADFKKLSK